MTKSNAKALSDPTAYAYCLAPTPWMTALRQRPPLTERHPELTAKRIQIEKRFRSLLPGQSETDPVTLGRGILMAVLRLGLKLLRLYEKGRKNALDLRLNEEEFFFQNLPPGLEGVRILHLSDLHLPRRFPAFAEKAAALLDGLTVDLCVMTGDYRWGYFGPVDHAPEQISTILSGVRSRYGVVGVFGNHDSFIMGETLEKEGIPLLFNEGIALPFGADTLWVGGIDDPHIFRCTDLKAATAGAPENAWKLLLAHSPEKVREAEALGFSLYLCGHTHGGQIRLAVIGALSYNASCRRSQILGWWQYKNMQGYTSAGLGTTDLPVRYLCPPEATLFTLRKAPKLS